MSRGRHYAPCVTWTLPPGAGAVVVGEFPMAAGHWFPAHVHDHHQVAWTPRGVVAVAVGDDHWVLPPTRALWIPAGVVHRTGAPRQSVMLAAYLDPARCRVAWPAPTAVPVDGLFAELLRHLHGDLPPDERRNAEELLQDRLRPLPVTAVRVPTPPDERAARVARALHADPADPRGLDALARLAGTSPRTLSRLFADGTGLSLDRWRTRLRMQAALPLLAEGLPVHRVARAVGYATPSALVAAFRRTTGVAPGEYLRHNVSEWRRPPAHHAHPATQSHSQSEPDIRPPSASPAAAAASPPTSDAAT